MNDIAPTPNPARGEGSITISGTTVPLKATFGALMRIEERLGAGIMIIMQRVLQMDLRFTDTSIVLQELASAAGCKIKPAELNRLLFDAGYVNFAPPIMKVLSNAVTAGHEEVDRPNAPTSQEGAAEG